MATKKTKTKWRWDEYNDWKEEQSKADEPEQKTVRPGQCGECGHGSFQLKIRDGQMDRICKGCGVIVENV